MKIAIWGWWQGNNLGDNWIKDTLLMHIPNSYPLDTSISDFSEYDFVICGGGGLFIRNIISPWNSLPNIAFGIIGMGTEFQHTDSLAIKLYNKSTFFYVRDMMSVLNMQLPREALSYDITFLNPIKFSDTYYNKRDKALFIWRDTEILMKYNDFQQYIGTQSTKTQWYDTIQLQYPHIFEDDFTQDKKSLCDMLENTDIIVSSRFHGIVAAIQHGIPCIGIDIVPKIRAIMTEVGLEEYCLKLAEVDQLESRLSALRKSSKEIRKKMLQYRTTANKVLQHQIKNVNKLIKDSNK